MRSLFFTAGITLVWLSSLFNGTGLGEQYHTDIITIAALWVFALAGGIKRRESKISKDIFWTYGGMTVIFIGSAAIHGHFTSAAAYLSCMLIIYIFSHSRVVENSMRLAGFAVYFLGLSILAIYKYGTLLSGWNENTIAMIGLFSYVIFMSGFYNLRARRLRFLIFAAGGLMLWLTTATDSRSCLFTLIAAMVLSIVMKPAPIFLRSRKLVVFLLLIPLFIAVITVMLSEGKLADGLNNWSIENFNKSIFNGRDELWLSALQEFIDKPLFGSGDITANNLHNSAMACLTSFGIFGYAFWVRSLYIILKRGQNFIADPIVTGCMTAFLLINIQQSVELGMFSANPNLLIYLPLGLMLGRVNYLKRTS